MQIRLITDLKFIYQEIPEPPKFPEMGIMRRGDPRLVRDFWRDVEDFHHETWYQYTERCMEKIKALKEEIAKASHDSKKMKSKKLDRAEMELEYASGRYERWWMDFSLKQHEAFKGIVSTLGLNEIDSENLTTELGIMLDIEQPCSREFWWNKTITEAIKILIDSFIENLKHTEEKECLTTQVAVPARNQEESSSATSQPSQQLMEQSEKPRESSMEQERLL